MRAFVAVNLPAEVRGAIDDRLAPLRRSGLGVRWVAPESLHITLQFLGWVDDARVPVVCEGLEGAVAGAGPFQLTLCGFGAFPDERRPRVLWVGVDAPHRLIDVQHTVARVLETVGFLPEARPFHPHVTVARAERTARAADVAATVSAARELPFEASAVVESVDLMESRLLRGGARYSVVQRFPL